MCCTKCLNCGIVSKIQEDFLVSTLPIDHNENGLLNQSVVRIEIFFVNHYQYLNYFFY